MALIDDSKILDQKTSIETINPVGKREITHAIHDIDGTHSLIREWPPVMSLSIHWAMTSGLNENFDSSENVEQLTGRVGSESLPETDQFCVESAGLSAITQMEYGIRRAVELGSIPINSGIRLTEDQKKVNSQIIRRIWNGEERFDDVEEPQMLRDFINDRTPRLFKLYEKILNGACRDRNTKAACKDPGKWRVPGSMEFVQHLRQTGCINYFVTGAVIYEDGGMYEEVKSLGFEVGPGKMAEAIKGSSWDHKMPKDEVMQTLINELCIDPAGVDMGAVTISRLPKEAKRQRELQVGFGTNYILQDYTDPLIKEWIK
jgi:hypothetical protein